MAAAHSSSRLNLALPTLSVVAFLALWEATVRWNHIAPIFLPAPSAIFGYLVSMVANGSVFFHLGVTLLRIVVSFLVSSALGVGIGILMGMSRTLARVADPWIAALYPLPKIALIPLLIIWLGTGEAYILMISVITAFFPILISTYAGIREVDNGLIKAAQDLGAGSRQVQMRVVLPAAIPSIFSGLHLGMGVVVILVVAAEMIGGSSQSGIGYLLINAGQVMETEKVFACLILLALMGAGITRTQRWLEKKLAPWATGARRF